MTFQVKLHVGDFSRLVPRISLVQHGWRGTGERWHQYFIGWKCLGFWVDVYTKGTAKDRHQWDRFSNPHREESYVGKTTKKAYLVGHAHVGKG